MGRVFTITEGLENMGALKTGGQGSVYKGRRIGEIITAVKLLPTPIHSESADDKNFIDFQNEVEKLKKVNEQPNPNVVKILSSGITETGNLPFIEMEFIEGPDVEDLLKLPQDPVFTIKEVIKIAEQLSNALAHCHKVNVKHGDIKSNNVKFNIHTGNYVLLDFGLAIMSDEQRRTSLRQAGAIEFMAPEQSEGVMLFQTDVYSFGIILYELLAGIVPFPLKDKGEMARNMVMVAHMESTPPDILSLRQQNLPYYWSAEKREREMNVPQWLLDMVYKCLEKKPSARFNDGMELHDYIILNSTLTVKNNERSAGLLNRQQQENEKLAQEKQQLQNLLQQYQDAAVSKEQELANLKVSLARKDKELRDVKDRIVLQTPKKDSIRSRLIRTLLSLLLLMVVAAIVYSFLFKTHKAEPAESPSKPVIHTESKPKPRSVIGQYKVAVPRAYFHNEPDEATRRNAFMVPSGDTVSALDDSNGYVYTEYTNGRGQTSKGWVSKEDLMPLDQWESSHTNMVTTTPQQEDTTAQLLRAKMLVDNKNIQDALPIYKVLSDQQVPEAMYQYANLALQNNNSDIDCGTAIELLQKASDKGYTTAKRTLGFLYVFANNKEVLRLSHYDRCSYEKNFIKGSQLLLEAMMAGDSTAGKMLEQSKKNEAAGNTDGTQPD